MKAIIIIIITTNKLKTDSIIYTTKLSAVHV